MYKISASILGVIIAVMISLNGVLAGETGNFPALAMVHISGLMAVSILLLFIREKRSADKVPLFLNTGGLIGIFLILINARTFMALGASLTLSLGMIGQTLGSLAADSTGFLGMEKYKFDKRKLSGLVLLFAGALVMTESWQGDLINIILALIAGALVILSMIVNTQLSLRIGIFHGARRNYMAGFIASLVILGITGFPAVDSIRIYSSISPVYLLGGGILGVVVVAGSNKILPKIPVVYTTLLLFTGQIGAGIIIDYVVKGEFSLRKFSGAAIILLGLLVNMMIDRNSMAVQMAAEKS